MVGLEHIKTIHPIEQHKKTPAAKEAVKKNPKVKDAKNTIASTLKSKEKVGEKITRKDILKGNVKLKKEEVPKDVLKARVELIKKQQSKVAVDYNLSQTELESKAVNSLNKELGDEDREKLVKDRKTAYNKLGKYTIKGSDGKEHVVEETKFEHLQKKKPDIKKLSEKISPDLTKELLSVYGEKKVDGFADLFTKKEVKNLEEAQKVINDEILRQQKEKMQVKDKDGNPLLNKEQQEKALTELQKDLNNNPELAGQMALRAAGSTGPGISAEQARNVQPEALNLSGTASQKTLNLIKHFEGFVGKAFWDYKQWTRGYGTKAPGAGASISKEKATQELGHRVETQYNIKNKLPKNVYDSLSDDQKAAVTSFVFNLGMGKLGALNLNEYANNPNEASAKAVGERMKKYMHAGGKINKGLVKRRATEANIFIKGVKKEDSKDSLSTETPKKAA